MSISARVQQVQDSVASACRAAGRDPDTVRVLAASKTMSADQVEAALRAGQTLFGENRAQELRDKAPKLAALQPAPQWHFIGRLQKNKVKYVVRWASLIHTVDSLALAEAIDSRAQQPFGVLVQVNTGDDAAKGGVAPSAALDLCMAIDRLPGLVVRGLMTLPPWADDPTETIPHFEALADLRARGREMGLPLTELSMGMSRDFAQAIKAGATIVRIGTAIFGSRTTP